MINREKAKYKMQTRFNHINKSTNDVLDEIYNSVGLCSKCLRYRNNNRSYCTLLGRAVKEDWFCADFKQNFARLN